MTFEDRKGLSNTAIGRLPSWRRTAGARPGSFEGAPYGSEVSFFVVDAAPAKAPPWDRHPYSETLVVLAGRTRFELGGEAVVARAGDVVVAPPETAHGSRSLASERLRLVAIHAAGRMETTWLESTAAGGEERR